ncbi:hypothetical protein ARMGADRAFT_941148, partial [Armillaria gallica]
YHRKVYIYTSAITMFYTPSDLSGIGGMMHEHIQTTCSWRKGPGCYNCVFAQADENLLGFHGLHVAQVLLFFSI